MERLGSAEMNRKPLSQSAYRIIDSRPFWFALIRPPIDNHTPGRRCYFSLVEALSVREKENVKPGSRLRTSYS